MVLFGSVAADGKTLFVRLAFYQCSNNRNGPHRWRTLLVLTNLCPINRPSAHYELDNGALIVDVHLETSTGG